MDTCKALRPYQARLVTDFCRAAGDVLVEQPTGSGKTMRIVTLVAMQLGRRFTHAVISAPQLRKSKLNRIASIMSDGVS